MSGHSKPVRVAILGGGLAGAATFKGLVKHKNLKVDIFESAPEFREKGAAIGFTHSAICALELLDLKKSLDDAGAVKLNAVRFMMGSGPEKGTIITDLARRSRSTRVTQRSDFLMQMFKGVDESSLHAGKKLTKLEQGGPETTLFFEDGSTHVCDILLGADGIHSKVRKYIVGAEHEAREPVNSGWRAVWCLKPYDVAVKYLGADLINKAEPRQYGWGGEFGFVMHDILANGTLVQCVIDQKTPDDEFPSVKNDWVKTVTKPELHKMLEGWDPRLQNGMVDLVTNEGKESTQMVYHWHHKPIETFVKGPVAIVGDAAGATTPWQGSGGGMAMEDALLLSQLFEHVQTTADASAALIAYDRIQRPRRLKLIQSSYETGMLLSASHPEVGTDIEKLRAQIAPKWDWILDVDLEKKRDDALAVMREVSA